MTAQKIDGNALSQQLRADVTRRTMALKVKGITPGLAVVLVGDNPASQVYVRNKVKACQDSGLHSVLEKHPDNLTEPALLARIEALNADKSIHGKTHTWCNFNYITINTHLSRTHCNALFNIAIFKF